MGSIERDNDGWQVVVNKARDKQDMRRMKGRWGTPPVACTHNKGFIGSLERASNQGNIMAVDQFKGNWERVPVTVDSGAIDSVIPDNIAKGFKVKETIASKQGLKYRAANGTPILNEGGKTLQGFTNDGNRVT